MYQIGDQVVYGIHGICRVADREARVIDRKSVVYLVLEPVGQEGARYLVPTHNALAMGKVKPMLSREELACLLESQQIRTDSWMMDENLRKQTYRELINSADRARLLQMICTLYRHKARLSSAGKKIHMCDENFLRDAEKLMIGEISAVLGLDPDQAKQYLRNKLKEDA